MLLETNFALWAMSCKNQRRDKTKKSKEKQRNWGAHRNGENKRTGLFSIVIDENETLAKRSDVTNIQV